MVIRCNRGINSEEFLYNPNKGYSKCGCKHACLPKYGVCQLSHSFYYTPHLPWKRRVKKSLNNQNKRQRNKEIVQNFLGARLADFDTYFANCLPVISPKNLKKSLFGEITSVVSSDPIDFL